MFYGVNCDLSLSILSTVITFLLCYATLGLVQTSFAKEQVYKNNLSIVIFGMLFSFLIWLVNTISILFCPLSINDGIDYRVLLFSLLITIFMYTLAIWLNTRIIFSYIRLIFGSLLIGISTYIMHYMGLMSFKILDQNTILNPSVLLFSIFAVSVGAAISFLLYDKYKIKYQGKKIIRGMIVLPFILGIVGMYYINRQGNYLDLLATIRLQYLNYVSYKDLFYIVLFLILIVIIVSLCILLLEYKLEQKSRDLKKLNLQLAQLTIQDHLTKLPNRNFVEEYVKQLIASHRKSRKEIAILYIDLDRFKVVNDAFGHEIGDQLLIAVVQRMQNLLNHKNKLVRIGGDEFLFIIEETHLNEAINMAQNALDLIQHTYLIGGRKVTISASIGIALYPQHGVTYKDLLVNADIAMYSSKQRGRNAYRVYNETLDAQHLKSELLLENDLYKAVEEKQFILLYQPKFNDKKQLCGVEALIRWRHPKLGILGPDLFIDKAEKTGLIIPIGYWVLQQACYQIQVWEKSEQPFYPIAINLSALQFEHHALFENLEHALQTYQINPEHLSIEITETTAMRDIDLSVKSFERLRKMGIKIAIDDFGTGYSSFSYLKDLPLDELKIDKEFITNLIADSKEETILASIIELATKLGLTVTAEGVETSEQAEILIKLGCQQLQGFLFAKPMTAEALQHFKFEA